jgi:hypothetical protein
MVVKDRHADCMASSDAQDVGDEVARVRAWADRLQSWGRTAAARRALRDGLDRLGDMPELMIRLAVLERDSGDAAQAVEILRKVLGERPGDVAASTCLARMLLEEGRTEESAAIIEVLPRQVGGDVGELAGEIFRALGRHVLAVEAFGESASLSPRGRRLRRKSWWRCGGPFRRASRGIARSPQAPQPLAAPEPADALLEVVTWAEWLGADGRRADSRQAIRDALALHGRHPRLLRCLAELEESDGAPRTALYLWCEACRTAPGDVDIVCGLAQKLASTYLGASNTSRFLEAVQLLDAFPDQLHPKVRATRGDLFRDNGTPPSRVVAAYGTGIDLPAAATRDRRRCWWRSAGPGGQFLVHLAARWRGSWPVPAGGTAPYASAESEEVARLLDSLEGLRPSDAWERIEEAWHHYGRLPSLLLAHADLDWQEDADWRCLVLAAEALRADPGNVEAACYLGRSVDLLFDYHAAVEVLESLPVAMRRSVAVRVELGDLHRYAGNLALAAAAYGDPRDLDPDDRKSRRRSARRGLLQRRDVHSGDDCASFDFTAIDSVGTEVAQVLDRSRSLLDSPDHGRAVLDTGIAGHGRHPLLLLSLAVAQRSAGDRGACATLAAEALANARDNPLITAMAILELWLSDFDSEALRAFGELPDEIEDAPALLALGGRLCHSWDLPDRAVLAFGKVLLDASDRRMRRSCWWRSGGPHGRLRRSVRAEEAAAMSDWQLPEPQITALAALSLPPGLLTEARGDLSNYRWGTLHRTQIAPRVAAAWLYWALGPTAAVLATLALTVIEHLRWPANHMWQNVAVAGAAVGVTCAVMEAIRKRGARASTMLVLAACSAGSAAFLLGLPAHRPFSIGLVLVTLAVTVTAAYIAQTTLQAVSRIRDARWRRDHAVTAALSALLDLLNEVAVRRHGPDLGRRRQRMTSLENAALAIERDLPHTLRSDDPQTRGAITARARGAAAALRALKPSVALADETSSDDVTSQLRTLVTALAEGDLTALPQAQPAVAPPGQPRPWRWHAMQITRTVLVILAPPLVAFLLPLVVPLSGPGVAWLRLATLVWALLASIIALDPGISDKVSQMRAVLSLWRDAGSSQSSTGQVSLSSPAEPAPPATRPGPTFRSHPPYHRKADRRPFRS